MKEWVRVPNQPTTPETLGANAPNGQRNDNLEVSPSIDIEISGITATSKTPSITIIIMRMVSSKNATRSIVGSPTTRQSSSSHRRRTKAPASRDQIHHHRSKSSSQASPPSLSAGRLFFHGCFYSVVWWARSMVEHSHLLVNISWALLLLPGGA